MTAPKRPAWWRKIPAARRLIERAEHCSHHAEDVDMDMCVTCTARALHRAEGRGWLAGVDYVNPLNPKNRSPR